MAVAGELTVVVRLDPDSAADVTAIVKAFTLLIDKLADSSVVLAPDELTAVETGEAALRRSIKVVSP